MVVMTTDKMVDTTLFVVALILCAEYYDFNTMPRRHSMNETVPSDTPSSSMLTIQRRRIKVILVYVRCIVSCWRYSYRRFVICTASRWQVFNDLERWRQTQYDLGHRRIFRIPRLKYHINRQGIRTDLSIFKLSSVTNDMYRYGLNEMWDCTLLQLVLFLF